MSKKSRLNPKKGSRSTLQLLADQWILRRRKSGLRYLIRTDGTTEYVGYDVLLPHNHDLPNFYPGTQRTYGELISYNGQRGELTATIGRTGYEGHPLDVSTHFPCNRVATDLMVAARKAEGRSCEAIAYGDAIVVSDNRMHWTLASGSDRAVPDLEQLNDILQSPRTFQKSDHDALIFFHVEPLECDLVTIKLMFC